jgi:hypothetical protein
MKSIGKKGNKNNFLRKISILLPFVETEEIPNL